MKVRDALRMLSLILTLNLIGCATLPENIRNYPNPQIYNASFDKVWETCVLRIQEVGYIFTKKDRASGILITDWITPVKTSKRAFHDIMWGSPPYYRLTVNITSVDKSRTAVRVKFFAGFQLENGSIGNRGWGQMLAEAEVKSEVNFLQDLGRYLKEKKSTQTVNQIDEN